jgi:hypothetical protein
VNWSSNKENGKKKKDMAGASGVVGCFRHIRSERLVVVFSVLVYCTVISTRIYTSPFCFPPSILGGFVMGPFAAGVGFVGPLPCPLIRSMRWSPLLPSCR